MRGFVYILRSLKNGKIYIGSTSDIKRRIFQHEKGAVKATKGLLPIKLDFFQEYNNIILAKVIERRLKRLKRKDYIEKIIRDRIIKLGL